MRHARGHTKGPCHATLDEDLRSQKLMQFETTVMHSCTNWIGTRQAFIFQMSMDPDLLPGRECVSDGTGTAVCDQMCGPISILCDGCITGGHQKSVMQCVCIGLQLKEYTCRLLQNKDVLGAPKVLPAISCLLNCLDSSRIPDQQMQSCSFLVLHWDDRICMQVSTTTGPSDMTCFPVLFNCNVPVTHHSVLSTGVISILRSFTKLYGPPMA